MSIIDALTASTDEQLADRHRVSIAEREAAIERRKAVTLLIQVAAILSLVYGTAALIVALVWLVVS